MRMFDCPKFFACSVESCPLPEDDTYPQMGQNLVYTTKGKKSCYYVLEFFKENAESNFKRAGVSAIYEFLKSKSPVMTKILERSSKTKSRMARFFPKGSLPE